MNAYHVYFGEAHDNTFQFADAPTPFTETLARAASHLDFYAAAYYTACAAAFRPGGHLSESQAPTKLPLEGWKPADRLEREWQEVNEACRAADRPGTFVTFPGYEWQGDGTAGDHNVFSLHEGLPIFRVDTVSELYACLRGREALAIPHHTAYRPGRRGRDWSVFDPDLSPFTEILSIHGCSETDEEWVGMRGNSHMGPGYGPGTWQAALDRGLHVGAICSTDNWGEMPGHYGRGRMACLATDLSRASLWEAFRARRVYGVSGDRVLLDFTVNDAPMGAVLATPGPRHLRVHAVGADALDRVEILRNGRVIATHCHQGTWDLPAPGQRSRFKLRVECGWGPRPNEMPVRTRRWEGRLAVAGGRMLGVEKCWISPGHGQPELSGDAARFTLLTSTRTVGGPCENAEVFEFEATPEAVVQLDLEGQARRGTVAELAASSSLLVYDEECVRMLAAEQGIAPYSPERRDVYHHVAFKAKVHRAMPAAAYTAEIELEDTDPLERETHYRVRVEQRNGQRAWSSPIWVRPRAAAV